VRVFALLILATSPLLAACQQQTEAAAPIVRPVRTVTIEKREAAQPTVLTGRIEAEDNVALGFRISGRVLANDAKLGDRVRPGQLIARLESQNELNALRSAQADLASAEARLSQAQNHFDRQQILLDRDVVSRAVFDEAEQARQTAQSQVDAARAQVKAAQDMVSLTELEADAPGVVTATGPGAGEVVQAGQMIVRLARQGGRDAVFDVPAQLIRSAPAEIPMVISLRDDPAITANGRAREVAAQANATTRTFEVKVGLTDPPDAMRLGATVTGRLQIGSSATIEIPATALTQNNGHSAVWIVDPSSLTVAKRAIEVLDEDPGRVVVAKGLEAGDIVVTAGVHNLRQGQKIRVLGSER
jgi:membrane fusion protein, multidrug efflux system